MSHKERENKENRCVHTEHCCIIHGCKYGDESCPVTTKSKKQSYPCEFCVENEDVAEKMINRAISKHEPDALDLQCQAVFDALDGVEDKIGVLEQCIDFLRMDQDSFKRDFDSN